MSTFKHGNYNVYYDMQDTFDELYKDSKEGKIFTNIYKYIKSRNNILLAYRNIKRNKGAMTSGVDGKNIQDIKKLTEDELIDEITKRLENYNPKEIKRVYIPKTNGKKRPLGIPTIMDRIVQQCIKQILEPICEAKFHPHSYGFRPYRRAEHAISRTSFLINNGQMMFVVDIDIKGFFDNVNHSKLKKQLWTLGIRDKRVLSIISKMLKSPIKGEGRMKKGTPQGGILSPLLANVVLNELDWWVSSQWENVKTRHEYTQSGGKYRELRKNTSLKEGFIVRYADDFKIVCKDYSTAQRWFYAIKKWLKERLKLEISEEKSKITNLYKESSDFLGFEISTIKRKNKRVVIHKIEKQKVNIMHKNLKKLIKKIHKTSKPLDIQLYNSTVRGYHNYFRIGAHTGTNLRWLYSKLDTFMYNRFMDIGKKKKVKFKNSNYKHLNNRFVYVVSRIPIIPINGIRFRKAYGFTQAKTPYTIEGRNLAGKSELAYNLEIAIQELGQNYIQNRSIEYNDNRISKFSGSKGKCYVTGIDLTENIHEYHCHHASPRQLGGDDSYGNLIVLHEDIHRLIHSTKKETSIKYLEKYKNHIDYKRLNNLRKQCELEIIEI